MNNTTQIRNTSWIRLLASIFYDFLIVVAVLFLIAGIPLAFIPQAIHNDPVIELVKLTWYLLVCFAYFAGFWFKGGQTPGMKPWKLKLVDMQGNPASKKQVSLRFFAAMLSWGLAGFGFLWMFFDSENLSLHDRLSKTRLTLVEKKKS